MANGKAMKVKVRNWEAVSAFLRRSSRFRHKTAPKGGATNKQRDYREEG